MSCAHPLTIKNPYYHIKNSPFMMNTLFSPTNPYEFQVPCGYCLNCRVDKRNFLEDVFKYHFNKAGTGAFVTLTYDDYHVPLSKDGVPSLCKDDISKFIQRLRKKIQRLPYKVDGLSPDFKYICVGEVGGSGLTSVHKHKFLIGRPHYHFLFSGLDWCIAKKLLHDEWKGGIVDCGPIKKGGIRYVLKYYDKQQRRKDMKEEFEANGLESPFKKQSFGLCSDFVLSKRDEILSMHGSYKKGNLERPVPSYYKKVLFTGQTNEDKWNRFREVGENILSSYQWKPENGFRYSLRELNEYKHQLAVNKEKLLTDKLNQYYPTPPVFDSSLVDELFA